MLHNEVGVLFLHYFLSDVLVPRFDIKWFTLDSVIGNSYIREIYIYVGLNNKSLR